MITNIFNTEKKKVYNKEEYESIDEEYIKNQSKKTNHSSDSDHSEEVEVKLMDSIQVKDFSLKVKKGEFV